MPDPRTTEMESHMELPAMFVSQFPDDKYDIIYADPPWAYYLGDMDTPYDTMMFNEVALLDVRGIAKPDCLLFMWTTSPCMDIAINLGKVWGFEYKTVAFVWDKQRTTNGRYTLPQCEHCIVFKNKGGRIPPKTSNCERQFVSAKRRQHSRKPDQVREAIDRMFPDKNKIELFARGGPVEGWTVWGIEANAPFKTATPRAPILTQPQLFPDVITEQV